MKERLFYVPIFDKTYYRSTLLHKHIVNQFSRRTYSSNLMNRPSAFIWYLLGQIVSKKTEKR